MGNTFDPVYNGQPRELRNWPLNTESLKYLRLVISLATESES